VTLSVQRTTQGTLVPVRYRFAVDAGAPAFPDHEMVFVHAVDDAGQLMWTDDHEPGTPASKWKPGSVVEYSREMLVPLGAPPSHVQLEVGLFDPQTGARLPMSGSTRGQRAYGVATFDVDAATSGLRYRTGWNNAESEGGLDWRWTTDRSTVTLTNPRRDATLVLLLDQPVRESTAPSHVQVLVNDMPVEQFVLPPGARDTRRIPIPAAVLGDQARAQIVLTVDPTFVPKSVSALHSTDSRQLGIRVFTMYFEP
jgi:hypothetical protein